MSLLAPAFAFALLLAAVPVALHLFGRDRALRRRFPAARLLAAAQRRLSPHARLERWLLLALRVLVIAAIALTLARPVRERTARLPTMAGERQAAVVVLDDSLSMARRTGLRSLFDRARASADELVRAFPEGSEVAVLSTSDASLDPVGRLERDRAQVVEGLRKASASARAGRVTDALGRAAVLLGQSRSPRRRVYLVSDLQASGFDPAQPSPFLPSDAEDAIGLDVIRVGDTTPPNDAITALEVGTAGERGARRLRTLARLRSDGHPARARTLSLLIDGAVVARGLVTLPADGTAEKRFEYAIPSGQEPRWVEVALEPDTADSLPDDDRRAAPVHGGGGHILLVDGAPGASRREDETFYLEVALRAARGASAPIEVIHEEQLQHVELGDVAAIFLCNPRPSPALQVLAPFVTAGGGLFISVGDNLDAAQLSAQLAGVLPSTFEGARDLSGPGGVAGGALRLAAPGPQLTRRAPSIADERARDAWRAARTYRVALMRPLARDDAEREVLARFDDGSPALLERRVGRGRVIVLTTTIDRGWSDLAIQPLYPALVVELAEHLGAVRAGAVEADLLTVGQSAARPLARLAGELGEQGGTVELVAPGGARTRLVLDPKRPPAAPTLERPGRYELTVLDGAQPGPRPQLTFAAAVDPGESDAHLFPDEARLATPTPAAAQRKPPPQELWHLVAAGLLVLLLGEAVLGLRG